MSWEYSFNAHHDINTLVNYSGGDTTFSDRLAMMFVPGQRPFGSSEFNNTIFNPGNEPSFTTPYLFNFVGRQDLSVQYSRAAADAYYQPTPDGLPGNSDAGAMESWVLWSMIGLYPITGQTTFLIGSPWLSDLTISLGGGKSLTITSTNSSSSSSSSSSSQSIYVQSLQVNGQPWNKSWLTYNDIFANGGRLDFVLGPNPSNWSADGLPPPSPATEDDVPPPLLLPSIVDHNRFSWRVTRPVLATLASAVSATLVISGMYLYLRHRRLRLAAASGDQDQEQLPTTETAPSAPPRRAALWCTWPKRLLRATDPAIASVPAGASVVTTTTDATKYTAKPTLTTVVVKSVDSASDTCSELTESSDDDAAKAASQLEVPAPALLKSPSSTGPDSV